jgi:hypothetical protein
MTGVCGLFIGGCELESVRHCSPERRDAPPFIDPSERDLGGGAGAALQLLVELCVSGYGRGALGASAFELKSAHLYVYTRAKRRPFWLTVASHGPATAAA